MTTKYAATITGIIFGLGGTAGAARLDAINALGYPDEDTWEEVRGGLQYTDFDTLEITDAAYTDVDENGFNGQMDGYTLDGRTIVAIERHYQR